MENRKVEEKDIEEKRLNLQRMKMEVLAINETLSVPSYQRVSHVSFPTEGDRIEERKKEREAASEDIRLRKKRELLVSRIQVLEKELGPEEEEGKNDPTSLKEEAILVVAYINTCTKFKATKPTLGQLEEISKKDGSTWSRKLKIPRFLVALNDALAKKRNLAKKPTREFWINAHGEVERKLQYLADDIERKRRKDRRDFDALSVEDIET